MFPKVFIYNKSINTRKKDYEFLLNELLPCSEIFRLWQKQINKKITEVNWKAICQLTKELCIEFKASFPTSILCTVKDIHSDDLSAIISVEESDEDIALPDEIEVPLCELFPLKNQEDSCQNIAQIAEVVDSLHFFFKYLWYPWENTEDILLTDWWAIHMDARLNLCKWENAEDWWAIYMARLNLQYEMQSGLIDPLTVKCIRDLMSESVQVASALDIDGDISTEVQRAELVRNLIRKEQIKLELNLYESPDTRKSMIYLRYQNNLETNVTGFVGLKGSLYDLNHYIELAKSAVNENVVLKAYTDLQCAVKSLPSGSGILLAPGIHEIRDLGNLLCGGFIKGLDSVERATIKPVDMLPSPFMFITSYRHLVFEDVNVERTEGVLLSVFEKSISMVGCHLKGSKENTTIGIMVMSGCSVDMIDCTLTNLGTAVALKNNAKAFIQSTLIENCKQGIKVSDYTLLSLVDTQVVSCSVAGIVMQTKEATADIAGSTDILNDMNISTLQLQVTFKDNTSDVYIEKLI